MADGKDKGEMVHLPGGIGFRRDSLVGYEYIESSLVVLTVYTEAAQYKIVGKKAYEAYKILREL